VTRAELETQLKAEHARQHRLARRLLRTEPGSEAAVVLSEQTAIAAQHALELWQRLQGPRLVRSASPAAVRLRRYRARQRSGRVLLRVEVAEVELVEVLVAAGYVDEYRAADRQVVAAAVTRVLADWAARWRK
jgi:hypothetical protein